RSSPDSSTAAAPAAAAASPSAQACPSPRPSAAAPAAAPAAAAWSPPRSASEHRAAALGLDQVGERRLLYPQVLASPSVSFLRPWLDCLRRDHPTNSGRKSRGVGHVRGRLHVIFARSPTVMRRHVAR